MAQIITNPKTPEEWAAWDRAWGWSKSRAKFERGGYDKPKPLKTQQSQSLLARP